MDDVAEEQDWFRRVLDAAPDAMIVVAADGRVLHANARVLTVFGYEPAELIGRPIEILVPGGHSRHAAHRAAYFAAPHVRPMGSPTAPLMGCRKDGSLFPAEISLSPFTTRRGAVAIAAVRDVTVRKELEREAAALAEERDVVRLRDEFLSMASHELRTPLAALRLQVDSLARAAQRGEDGSLLGAKARAISHSADRLDRLIERLLDVSQLGAGELLLERRSTDLGQVAADTLALFADEIQRGGHRVELHAPQPVVGDWDPFRLEQVATNLLSNALKYGERAPIVISVDREDGWALLSVEDHGLGIAPDEQARIFARFARARGTGHQTGFGLGLWIAQRIAHAHGGSIRLESEPGAGARFVVQLPLSPA